MQNDGCKLGWFISTRMILPKSPYNIVKMEIYTNIICLLGKYMVINELKKYIWRKTILDILKIYMLR
jgi:hypothetical protein